MVILLFILAIIASFLVVRLGAVALELTGMEPRQARFQALSAFSGSGFTTREAELIVTHPARRKVVSLLIVGGNAGFVTMIATLAGSLATRAGVGKPWTLFEGALVLPGWMVPYAKLILIILGLVLLYRLSQMRPVARVITHGLRGFLTKQGIVHKVSFEEVLLGAQGHGISQIEIHENNPMLNRTLAELSLRTRGVLVLMIEREDRVIVPPGAENFARLGDRFTLFGSLSAIRELAVAEEERDEPLPEEGEDQG